MPLELSVESLVNVSHTARTDSADDAVVGQRGIGSKKNIFGGRRLVNVGHGRFTDSVGVPLLKIRKIICTRPNVTASPS